MDTDRFLAGTPYVSICTMPDRARSYHFSLSWSEGRLDHCIWIREGHLSRLTMDLAPLAVAFFCVSLHPHVILNSFWTRVNMRGEVTKTAQRKKRQTASQPGDLLCPTLHPVSHVKLAGARGMITDVMPWFLP